MNLTNSLHGYCCLHTRGHSVNTRGHSQEIQGLVFLTNCVLCVDASALVVALLNGLEFDDILVCVCVVFYFSIKTYHFAFVLFGLLVLFALLGHAVKLLGGHLKLMEW